MVSLFLHTHMQHCGPAGSPHHVPAAVPAGVLCVDALISSGGGGEDERVSGRACPCGESCTGKSGRLIMLLKQSLLSLVFFPFPPPSLSSPVLPLLSPSSSSSSSPLPSPQCRHPVAAVLCDVLRATNREKVQRVILATFRVGPAAHRPTLQALYMASS